MPHFINRKIKQGSLTRPTNYLLVIYYLMLLMMMVPFIRAENRAQNDSTPDVDPFYGSLNFPREKYVPIRGDFPHVYGIRMPDFNFTCSNKTIGFNSGMVCKLDNITYHMKLAVTHEIVRLPEISNLQLAESLGAITPAVGYFLHNNSNIYIASQKIDDVTFAKDFYKDYMKELKQRNGYVRRAQTTEEFTALIKEKMPDHSISLLTVLKAFIDDLTNVENWGFNSKGQLVIIDADRSPQSVGEYFDRSTKSIDMGLEVLEHKKKYKYMTVNLSLKNILQMKKIFGDMFYKPLPAVRSNFYPEARALLDNNYKSLLKAHIHACNDVINQYSQAASQKDWSWNTTSSLINSVLAKSILNVSQQNFSQYNIDDLLQPTATEQSFIKEFLTANKFRPTHPESDDALKFKIFFETVSLLTVFALLYKKLVAKRPASSSFFKSAFPRDNLASETANTNMAHGLRVV